MRALFDRNLFYVLARMNLRASHYRSVMGTLWSFMGPFFLFIVTYFIFRDRFGHQIRHFPLLLLTAIICINFFSNVVGYTIRFFSGRRDILLNSVTPIGTIFLASLIVPVIKFSVEIGLCLIVAAFTGVLNFLYLPLIFILLAAFFMMAAGAGLMLAVLNSLAGDVEEIWYILARTLIFITPTFYTLDMLSPQARGLIRFLNPLTPATISLQSLISGHPVPYFDGAVFFQAILYAVLLLAAGMICFRRFRHVIVESL